MVRDRRFSLTVIVLLFGIAFFTTTLMYTLNATSCKEMKPSAYLHLLEESKGILNTPENFESRKYETIHVAIMINNTKQSAMVLKSVLFYRHSPIHFHFITNSADQKVLETMLSTWQLLSVSCSFYSIENLLRTVPKFLNKKFFTSYDGIKLMLGSILPLTVEKVIVLDDNIVVLSDLQQLWTFFDVIKAERKTFSFVSNTCLNLKSTEHFRECFRANVMLLDLVEMRKQSIFFKFWDTMSRQANVYKIIKTLLMYNTLLPCEWNVRLTNIQECSQKYRIIEYKTIDELILKIAEYPSLNITLEYDNFLLKYLPKEHGSKVESSALERKLTTYEDVCNNLKEQSQVQFLTHTFFYGNSYTPVDEYDVTLITQLTMDRIRTLHNLLLHWNGPASITMYGDESEKLKVMQYFKSFSLLRPNLVIHIVYRKPGSYYPINYLRNVAASAVTTPYVFLIDLDFMPSYGLYSYLRKAAELLMTTNPRRALVVPAFEAFMNNTIYPKDKPTLLEQMKELTVQPFHPYFKGHTPTNYTKWVKASYPYVTNWAKDYEPYVLVRSNVVRYDQRFMGYGFNKISHLTELRAQGYEFVVLPDPFLIHYPHPYSEDRLKVVGFFKVCNKDLYITTYLNELRDIYGKDSLYSQKGKTRDIMIKIE